MIELRVIKQTRFACALLALTLAATPAFAVNKDMVQLQTRMNALEKALQSVQSQQQSINAALQNLNPANSNPSTPGTAPANAPSGSDQQPAQPGPMADAGGKPSSYIPFPTHQGPPRNQPSAPESTAPPVADLYKTALSDFMAAKYPLATTEFGDVIHNYPDDPLSGNAYYYLGQIDYTAGKFAAAVKDYDHVITQFPANPKVPVARLHKGMALFALKDRDAGVAEMRGLIQRFPNSPEAAQARAKLNGMGVPGTARRQ